MHASRPIFQNAEGRAAGWRSKHVGSVGSADETLLLFVGDIAMAAGLRGASWLPTCRTAHPGAILAHFAVGIARSKSREMSSYSSTTNRPPAYSLHSLFSTQNPSFCCTTQVESNCRRLGCTSTVGSHYSLVDLAEYSARFCVAGKAHQEPITALRNIPKLKTAVGA